MFSSHIHDPWFIDNLQITLRLVIAVLLGGFIGLEREKANHPAGLRTHIIVCLGSALIMMLSMYGFSNFVYEDNVRIDPARLATAVITGIGFLGAGTIILKGNSIAGLTTAASLWVVAAIGLAVGAGFYYPAIITTLFMIIILFILNRIEQYFFTGKRSYILILETANSEDLTRELSLCLQENGILIEKMSITHEEVDVDDAKQMQMRKMKINIIMPPKLDVVTTLSLIESINGIRSVMME